MPRQISHDFRAVSRPLRLHSGNGALEQLGPELARAGINRALLITGRSLAEGTDLVDRMQASAEGRIAAVFGAMRKDTPLPDVQAATALAREVDADGLIALGGGSVIQGARVTAILLAETGTPEALATQYPDDGPAISPRLLAPKLPIFNALTIGTTAQDRGGSPVKAPELGRRLEYFDPKTRPAALFWDRDALATAPESMLRATVAMTYWRALLDMGASTANVLADLNRAQVWTLTKGMQRALAAGDDGDALRGDLCVATWLQNRAVDDGARPVETWVSRLTYAFSVALFHQHGDLAQGAATSALAPSILREMGARDPAAMAGMAEALSIEGRAAADLPQVIADRLTSDLAALGHATDLTALGISPDGVTAMLDNAMSNFNADPRREFRRERDRLAEVLAACW
ncbi:iron-containing alcohol dehydrogenase [Pseudooceanicola sp.]|uniref:iron-containing alcohol dehydrogenase n=1 Tax=Pseudooceanicola sp. TaxID=1914328 RepID=UPI0026387310|nr:iron-containing alcohol dehydrogenase [Pseudooceanicola sp.]MDF1856115.1 iron-containing alcohol dehydrogenase [Pseudooceanicola sp.]